MQRKPQLGVGLALAQLGLLLLIGLMFQLERRIAPRAWAVSEPVDPNLLIRGRYVSLRLVVPLQAQVRGLAPSAQDGSTTTVDLKVQGTRLVALAGSDGGRHAVRRRHADSQAGTVVVLKQPLAFFIPPDVADPSIRPETDPLWVEVTLPLSGPPRPIRLGLQRGGRLVPLDLRDTEDAG